MMPPQSLVTKPLVTIAIPCFNAESTIERAIESAQNQDWPNTEILIVEDGSDDGSGALIEALAKNDKKIRLIYHESNQGLSVVRNTAIGKAQGEFIAFFDADDVSYPERISLQYQRLTSYEQEKKVDLVLCYSGVRGITLRGKLFYEKGIGHQSPEPVGQDYIGHYIPLNNRVKKCAWGHSAGATLFMRRAIFDRIGPFDASLQRAEDADYTIRAGLKGAHFISVNQTLFDWHITEADYKSNKKELHYQFLMYGKYRYLFPNKFSYFFSLQRVRATVGFDFAKKRGKYFLTAWYFGWASLCYLLVSPRVFSNRAWYRLENIFKNRRANRTALTPRKAGKNDAAEARQVMAQPLEAQPLVTIAIPCFNAESTIERAIKSAQNQDWPTIEILIVDDDSEDSTISIIEALAKEDKRIRLICHESNQGVAVARNTLLENAKGEFIAFFDADDVSYPQRINLQYQRLTHYEQKNKADLVLCYAGRKVIPDDGAESYERRGVGNQSPEPVGQDYIGHYIPLKNNLKKCAWGDSASSALFMRRAVFDFVGPFDTLLRRGQDSDYAIRAACKGAHFISVDQTLLDWHITDADYKADKILLHYYHLMYQKYKYLFPNKFSYFFSLQRVRATVGFDFAKKRGKYFLTAWYFALASLCYLLVSPRIFLIRAWYRLENIFRNSPANKDAIIQHKAAK